MNKSDILYSVVITSYKRDVDIVKCAVQSIMKQTNVNYEIIIVDDNPEGNEYSQALRAEFENKNPKIRYIKQKGNRGACAARNLGIEHANAKYIGFLDDDDTWEPTKAEKQLAKFTDESVGMVYCLGNVVDKNVSPAKIYDYYTAKSFKEEVSFQDLLIKDNIGSTSQAFVSKKCFEECGGFDENLPARQDYEMWLRIGKKYRIVGVNERLFNHYLHDGDQISKDMHKSMKGLLIIHKKYSEDYKNNIKAEETWLTLFVRAAKKAKSPIFWVYGVKLYFIRRYLLSKEIE